jgi:hypothetical protein
MAATHIPFDRSNQFGQELKALLNAYRKVVTDGPIIIAALQAMIDGNGTDVSHFTEMVTVGIFDNTADAKASFDELSSVNGKLTTNNSVSSVEAALLQVCSKHGII